MMMIIIIIIILIIKNQEKDKEKQNFKIKIFYIETVKIEKMNYTIKNGKKTNKIQQELILIIYIFVKKYKNQ